MLTEDDAGNVYDDGQPDPLNEQKGFGSGAGTTVVTDPAGVASESSGSSGIWGFLKPYKTVFDKITSGTAGANEYAAAAGIIGLLTPSLNKPRTAGWKGSIDMDRKFTRTPIQQPEYTPYAQSQSPVMGRQFYQSSYGAPTPRAGEDIVSAPQEGKPTVKPQSAKSTAGTAGTAGGINSALYKKYLDTWGGDSLAAVVKPTFEEWVQSQSDDLGSIPGARTGTTDESTSTPYYITGLAGVQRPVDKKTGYMYETDLGGPRMKGWSGGDLSVRDGQIYEGGKRPAYMRLEDGRMVSTDTNATTGTTEFDKYAEAEKIINPQGEAIDYTTPDSGINFTYGGESVGEVGDPGALQAIRNLNLMRQDLGAYPAYTALRNYASDSKLDPTVKQELNEYFQQNVFDAQNPDWEKGLKDITGKSYAELIFGEVDPINPKSVDVPGGFIYDTRALQKNWQGGPEYVFVGPNEAARQRTMIAARLGGEDVYGRTTGIIPNEWSNPITQTFVTNYNAKNPSTPLTPENYMKFYRDELIPGLTYSMEAQRQNEAAAEKRTVEGRAHGGLASLSHDAQNNFAEGGSISPRYLRGATDGMADEIRTSIDGAQPAALSHGEFVIPADVVAHLGNGNSDAGAEELYEMMDRVRQARTGTKEQGKKINPKEFTFGGSIGYAGGGAVTFQTGGIAGADTSLGSTSEKNISEWAGPYVGEMLSNTNALVKSPYEAYKGPLVAGTSPLQTQAFSQIGSLGTPSQFDTATKMADFAGKAAQGVSYTPTSFTAPSIGAGSISSTYQAPSVYQGGIFDAKFKAPVDYKSGEFSTGFTPSTFNTGLGALGSVQDYMSPYQQNVIDIQAREARRQADISRATEQSRMAQAGAYGGSRQAIMEAERQRNLGTQIGDIQEKGLQSAYDRALAQRAQEAEMGLKAQQFGEQSRQFGTTSGLQAQQFGEQSRQFGATQGLNAAQLASQFGLDAQKAQELSRQFNYGQQMTAAQLQAQFGLDAARANQLANLQAATANQRASMEAQQFGEQSKQFGASLGMQGIGQQLAAAGLLGSLGSQQFSTGLQGINALLAGGAQQRATEQEGITALQKQYETELLDPYIKLRFQKEMLQGLPVATEQVVPNTSVMGDIKATGADIASLMKLLGLS